MSRALPDGYKWQFFAEGVSGSSIAAACWIPVPAGPPFLVLPAGVVWEVPRVMTSAMQSGRQEGKQAGKQGDITWACPRHALGMP